MLERWMVLHYNERSKLQLYVRRLHPGKFEAELKQFEDAAFDRLW